MHKATVCEQSECSTLSDCMALPQVATSGPLAEARKNAITDKMTREGF